MKTSSSVNAMTRSAIIAALYVLITLVFQPISFGAIQFRIAEALMLLPVLSANAVPGLFAGCLLANLLCGGVWFDVVFGSVATLLAAAFSRRFRSFPALAAAMLRSQGVPTKMIFGYVAPKDLYHAWNMFYTDETGWVLVGFEAGADTWNRIDLTFAAGGADAQFIGDGSNYSDVYFY